jgi:flagellar hook protein FlgE
MGLTSSLFAGLSGMKTNEFRMDVIGNNIANVNTNAYKSTRATFKNQFSQTFSFGSAASGKLGGTNPIQVGTGSGVGAMNRDFSMGAPESTGIKTDLSIQGQGLFILASGSGGQTYTRDGSFAFNASNELVNASGYYLQGYNIDSNFNIIDGTLDRLRIPLGEITTSAITSYAKFSGNLNADASIKAITDTTDDPPTIIKATPRQELTSAVLTTGAGAAFVDSDATTLVSINKSGGTAGADMMFEDGNVLTMVKATKGGATLGTAVFDITATSTVADLNQWLKEALGIFTVADFGAQGIGAYETDAGATPPYVGLDTTPGAVLDITTGQLKITGNIGYDNNISLGSDAITLSKGTGIKTVSNSIPFVFTKTITQTDATELKSIMGESVRTSYRAFDSLGNPLDISITLVKEGASNNGITWRYFAESNDDSDVANFEPGNSKHGRSLGTGTILLDTNGNYISGENLTFTVDRDKTGAAGPQSIDLDFTTMNGFELPSSVALLQQDGFQAGTLQDYSISTDGIIIGSFDNGLTRTLGQVVVASFRNYEGLIDIGNNQYKPGPNSGDQIVKKPLDLGAGGIMSASLELSNVDLSREFINLIISSTGFSASSRIIQTSDQLLNELIALAR